MSKKPDVIQYLLWTLSSYEKDDIDSDDFEVAFENEQGIEGFASCSITEAAADALCLIETLTKQRDELLEALESASSKMKKAHSDMFDQCLSNPVKNAWGKPVDVSSINDLQLESSSADKLIAKAKGGAA